MRSRMARNGLRTLGSGGDLPFALGGLTAWWSARDIAQAADTNVAFMPDRSGNGFSARQTEDKQPNYQTGVNGINGRPAISFLPANSEHFDVDGLPIPASSRNYTIFAAVKTGGAWQPDAEIFAERNTADDSSILGQFGGKSSGTITHDVRDDADLLVRDGVTALTTNTAYVLGCSLDGTGANAVKSAVNGVWSAGTSWTPGTITLNKATIGVASPFGGDTGFWTGVIGDLVVFNRTMTTAEKLQMDRYLGNYYGITVA